MKRSLQDEETALHCAASRGHIDCVRQLLYRKNRMSATDYDYETLSMHQLQQQINMQDKVESRQFAFWYTYPRAGRSYGVALRLRAWSHRYGIAVAVRARRRQRA